MVASESEILVRTVWTIAIKDNREQEALQMFAAFKNYLCKGALVIPFGCIDNQLTWLSSLISFESFAFNRYFNIGIVEF